MTLEKGYRKIRLDGHEFKDDHLQQLELRRFLKTRI